MRFIDLFAGLGGFHLALRELGHECVFASEIDEELQKLYVHNFGLEPTGDIRTIPEEDIPSHNILCAGFPCQPFSKAGKREGFACPNWGDLFNHIIRIAKYHKPEFILLENVSNLERHEGGKTWSQMYMQLHNIEYDVRFAHLSPDEFGIPQVRRRMFIVARRGSLSGFQFPKPNKGTTSIKSVLDTHPIDARQLPSHFIECLGVWQEFLDYFPKDEALPAFPIWTMEFGATYPYEEISPHKYGMARLSQFRGSFGIPLDSFPANKVREQLPRYAQTKEACFPRWKVGFIRKNRELYAHHKEWFDGWLPKIRKFPNSLQKFEWNVGQGSRSVWDYVIRFRPSGVRIKRPTTAPSLNTIETQLPIIGWERRFMTMRECARLHRMDNLELPKQFGAATNALGNAVNVEIVRKIAAALLTPQYGSQDIFDQLTFSSMPSEMQLE